MLEKVIEILREYKQEKDLAVTAKSTFSELGLDSLDTVELVMRIEEEFQVSIEMDGSIACVGDLVQIIEGQT